MLYDKRWDAKTKSDIFSLENIVAWLETMPPDEAYNFQDCDGECLFGQYARSQGIGWKTVWGTRIHEHGPQAVEFKRMLYGYVARVEPWTFGAALERARAAVSRPLRGGEQ